MKLARLLIIVFVSLIAVGLVFVDYHINQQMVLNYSGYCAKEARFLSNDEKIRMVVERSVVGRDPQLPFWPLRDKENNVMKDARGRTLWVFEGHKEPVEPVSYRNIDEFFALNPDCCEVRRYYADSEGRWEPDFWDRVFGDGGGVVRVTYQYRYRDQTGIEHDSTFTYQEILNNCGTSYSPFS